MVGEIASERVFLIDLRPLDRVTRVISSPNGQV